jgi:TIR domain
MVVLTKDGWRGADDKFYASSQAAKESIANKMGWSTPKVSRVDRTQERPLRVFVSYAREDEAAARRLYWRLEKRKVEPWLDVIKLLPGQKWRVEIGKAIRSSDAFLACLSPVAATKVGFLNSEFKQALEIADRQPEGKVFTIPVKLEPCDVPQRFGEFQWVDYFRPNGFKLLMRSLTDLAQWLRDHESRVLLPNQGRKSRPPTANP